MRALTLRQPWAGAIFHGKDVENRPGALSFRGTFAVHAGQHLSPAEAFDEVEDLAGIRIPTLGTPRAGVEWAVGAIIGTARIVGAHRWVDCQGSCSPWAQPGRAHLVIEDPVLLRRPVPARGQQTLWTLDDDLLAAVRRHTA